ncbi:hypothetical protein SAMN02746041_02936 [Desulfacinum hydrothermale DSM 13146]|uniref:Uncharacterized protein n=1 Tax=Desulfacinum hydrothermale DSM 13146 TaxID=1121390 RepID=A0A1W1XV07_9BACT|nr:hypothetical protein [Desulfacinum hydrothermale]SMC27371.1 hypothetical protein SAMN02746041_02936 [Desulfacinum hydrothermale DSM 13146]
MGRIKEKLEAMAAAIAFAEADEREEALRLLEESERTEKRVETRKDQRQRPRPRVYRT